MKAPSGRRGDRRRSWRHALLLASVVALQFGYPITYYGDGWTALYMVAYAGMMLFGVRVAAEEDQHLRVFYVLAGCAVIGGTWFAFQQHEPAAQLTMLITMGLFQLALLIQLARMILHARQRATPASEVLMVALSAYLLLGGVFAIIFNLVETASPGSFVDAAAPDTPLVWQGMIYTSYVILTTLGFGEVLAVTPWARSLVTLEAVLGTLFLAIVIARLVGAVDSDTSTARVDNSTPDSTDS